MRLLEGGRRQTNLERALVAVGSEFVSLWRSRVETEVYWDVWEAGGRRPDAGEGQSGAAARHPALVVERVGNGDVAVPADAAQMQQRRRREEHVIGVEHIACQRPEQPLASYNLRQHRSKLQPIQTYCKLVTQWTCDCRIASRPLHYYVTPLGNTRIVSK